MENLFDFSRFSFASLSAVVWCTRCRQITSHENDINCTKLKTFSALSLSRRRRRWRQKTARRLNVEEKFKKLFIHSFSTRLSSSQVTAFLPLISSSFRLLQCQQFLPFATFSTFHTKRNGRWKCTHSSDFHPLSNLVYLLSSERFHSKELKRQSKKPSASN